MSRIITTILLIICISFAIYSTSNTAEMRGVDRKTVSIAHIGDSYSSGTGAGLYDQSDLKAYRSANNWGSKYNNWLKSNGVSSTYLNLAQSGATSNQVLTEQIITVPTNTDLILMTIGGNDVNFGGIVESCLAPYMARVKDCREKIESANEKLPDVGKDTYKIFESLKSRLKNPNAQIVLVAYPLLSSWTNNLLMDCDHHFNLFCDWNSYYPAAKMVRELGFQATAEQQKIVDLWNSKNQMKVDFVAHTPVAFSNHEPATGSTINRRRWINFIGETDTVYYSPIDTTIGRPTTTTAEYYHPGITGHQKIAELVQNQIGIPKSARTITPTSGDIDIAFVVDTTGSMGYSINSVKNNIQEIINETSQKSNSSRFALVSYQDFPESSGIPEDYPSKVHTNFTSDVGKIKTEVANLTLGHGGDWEETAYSGAMAALDLDWRPGVKKIMIILADAPPKDPEPITGYTAQIVARRAFEIDPVEVSLIDSESAEYGGSFRQLVHESDGKLYKSWDEGGVTQAIVSSITNSLAKPFAWIQGPYIVKIGDPITFDARGSYSSNGEIVKYEWDFNGDGVYDKTTTSGETTETFQSEHWGYMGIRITDSTGLSSVGSTEFIASDDGDSTPRDIDNCPDVYNHAQIDTDGDGIGDECDPTHGVPDWLDGSQNPEGLIDGIIMFKTGIPEYIKLAYGSNDQYIDSLIKDGQSISEINATIRNLNLKISDETNKKLETINSQDQNDKDNQEEEKQDSKPDSAEKSNKSPVVQENKASNAMTITIIVAATAIIAIVISVIILTKKRKSI